MFQTFIPPKQLLILSSTPQSAFQFPQFSKLFHQETKLYQQFEIRARIDQIGRRKRPFDSDKIRNRVGQ